MYHELKPEQIETFEQLLLDVTVACDFAFRWVDNPAVKELFKWLNPMLELPDRKQLSGRILKKASNNLKDIVFNDAINDDLGIMLAFDECNMIIWKVEDISGKRCTSDIIIDETKKSFDELEKKNIKINGLITDSTSENVAARKRLHFQYQDKIFLPCFVHQMNLCIGDIFKESSSLSNAAEGTISLITFFSRSKIIGILQKVTQKNCIGLLNEFFQLLYQLSTASLERLFSTIGWYHSKRRNRLKAEKVLSLAQIRASMQRQQQLYELDYHAKQYQITITRTSDNIEFARLENDDEIFILSDNEDSDTDSKTNEYDNESINNIYTQPLASANEWRKTVIDWIEMIENELQDQHNKLASITDTYDISIENIEQIQLKL
ncbi:DUF659 and ribonuclease H-like domain containing protein [Rhizophagus irregularis DAOM 181602=DAOM 197198]|nr:DUF659 and ribonuclease H-like domain containing protein [Rhizophagus irregularis DAOM 181602=DAOM 197198]